MSWDITLLDENGNTMQTQDEHKLQGGNIRVDRNLEQIPIRDAELNITYNYSKCYHLVWGHALSEFDGKKAVDIIPKLKQGIEKLGTTTHQDYWAGTPGNAGKALENLLFLCEQCPDGIIEVS